MLFFVSSSLIIAITLVRLRVNEKKNNNRKTNEFQSVSLFEDVMWYVLMFGL